MDRRASVAAEPRLSGANDSPDGLATSANRLSGVSARGIVAILGIPTVWSASPVPLDAGQVSSPGSAALLTYLLGWGLVAESLVFATRRYRNGGLAGLAASGASLLGGSSLLLLRSELLYPAIVLATPAAIRPGVTLVASSLLFRGSQHLAYLAALALGVTGLLWIIHAGTSRLASTAAPVPVRRCARRIAATMPRLAAASAAALAALMLIEAGLMLAERVRPSEGRIEMPSELRYRPLESGSGYYWIGKPHTFNRKGFRGDDWPAPGPGRYRIAVLGDSFTYGYGVSREESYPARIEALLGRWYEVEVLNLGMSGYQTEDIVRLAASELPGLKPQLVLYGHCLNDFLPSGRGEYRANDRLAIPIPDVLKTPFVKRTTTGAVLADRYDRLLMRMGIRNDFFDDILKDFRGYVTRFSRDVRELNELVTSSGLPPVVSLVLTRSPSDPRGREISRIAEEKMSEAGMTVIPSAAYQDAYARSGVQLHVNQWEGHPNEVAHDAFAREFVRGILADPELARRIASFVRPPAGGDGIRDEAEVVATRTALPFAAVSGSR